MDDEELASLFSWSPALDQLYRQLMPADGRTVAEVAEVLRVSPEELRAQLVPMIERGIVSVDDDVVTVAEPGAAVTHMLSLQRRLMEAMGEELGRIISVLPALLDAGPFGPRPESDRVAGEVTDDLDVMKLLLDWVRGSTGDICLLRPEARRLEGEDVVLEALVQAVAGGRRVRSIYPAFALAETPELLEARVAAGEEVRVVPEVITRMVIVGVWRAIVPEPLGLESKRRVTMRQPAVVALCQAWFDLLWERGTPVLDAGGREDRRHALLVQLARGVKDEQIARTLDVSLRTVRRGVADLLVELGVDTRFQAGVEAVRRGWL
jgi:DNA-binding CsgD family transcriptional regulator